MRAPRPPVGAARAVAMSGEGGGDGWAARKARSIVEAPVVSESPALLSALGAVPVEAVARPQRLRSSLEAGHLAAAKAVLAQLEVLSASVAPISSAAANMSADVAAISNRLASARIGAQTVVGQTAELRSRKAAAERKAQVVTRIATKFILSQEEKEALAPGAPVTHEFLAALARLEKIHDTAKAVLLRCGQQRTGLEIVERAAATREEAYERLYKFVQAMFSSPTSGSDGHDPHDHQSLPLAGPNGGDEDGATESAGLLRNAICALRARPVLLSYCADEVGSARRAMLVNRFVVALTRGGPGGVPKPIEVHAHDPIRYTNDMLAWIHQTLASERELMGRLFEDGVALSVLNTMFDALCRPFRVRFEQALEPVPPVVVLYKLASLLEFYASTLEKYLGDQAALPAMLLECNSVAMYAFFSSWKTKMEAFQGAGAAPPEDLCPPVPVMQSMSRLNEIMLTLDASLTPAEARQGQIHAVLEVILTPLLKLCEKIGSRAGNTMDQSIFLANCVDAMRAPLVPYAFAAPRLEKLMETADVYVERYIEAASTAVLRRCGLYDRLCRLRDFENGTRTDEGRPLSREPGMDLEGMAISMKHFYAVVFSSGGSLGPIYDEEDSGDIKRRSSVGSASKSLGGNNDPLSAPRARCFINGRMRNQARTAVASIVAEAHASLHGAVVNPGNGYGPDAARVAGLRSPDQVSLILSGRQ